jgi:hypothetical protein
VTHPAGSARVVDLSDVLASRMRDVFASPAQDNETVPTETPAEPTNVHPLVNVGRRQAILDFIASHLAEHGYPPSMRAVGAAVGLRSVATVQHHLHALEAEGKLRAIRRGAHTLKLEVVE